MYLNILKKDLKRKKVMNTILLIFMILATTFIGASVTIFVSITTAMASYFEKAQLTDFISMSVENEPNDQLIKGFLEENKYVAQWWEDEGIFITNGDFKQENGEELILKNAGVLTSFDIHQQKFFDSENQLITEMEEGTIYLPLREIEENQIKIGDKIVFEKEGQKQTFKVLGQVKDVFLGPPMISTPRFIVSSKDFERLSESGVNQIAKIYSINTPHIEDFKENYTVLAPQTIFSVDKELIRTMYVMDTIIAGILIIVSICLILMALVILRFTIVFSLSEEFREIGIMKAIGIRNRKIGTIYIIKYLGIAVVGAVVGLGLSIPFSQLFIREVSRNMIIKQSPYSILINVLCAVLVIGLVFIFCYGCTRKINKIVPIEAIRKGTKSERFSRKGLIKLSGSRLPTTVFMVLNDLVSHIRKYTVSLIIFTLGILLIIIPINSINTLKSDHIITWFNMLETDVYLARDAMLQRFMKENGRDDLKQYLSEVEETLRDEGIAVKATCEMFFKFRISFEDRVYNTRAYQGTGNTADQYTYMEGTPPQYADEIAITHIISEKIGAGIGDKVNIKIGDKESVYMVTALFECMEYMGEGIRFSEKAPIDYSTTVGSYAIQLDYLDELNKEERTLRFEQLKTIFPEAEVYTASQYVCLMIGDIASQLDGMKQLIVMVILLINMLVALLMVKTFITKEKGEIAILKAIGFKTSELMLWQSMRIGSILGLATFLGGLLSGPISSISTEKVFEVMGVSSVKFEIIPWEVYGLYPAILLGATMLGGMLAALQIRNIKVQEINHIE